MASKSKQKKVPFVIRLDADVLQVISLAAAADNRSVSNYMETQLAKLHPNPSATAQLAPQVQNLGGYIQPDDDIL